MNQPSLREKLEEVLNRYDGVEGGCDCTAGVDALESIVKEYCGSVASETPNPAPLDNASGERYNYKFLDYPADTRLDLIAQNLFAQSWEVVSHSSTAHGMTLLLRQPLLEALSNTTKTRSQEAPDAIKPDSNYNKELS